MTKQVAKKPPKPEGLGPSAARVKPFGLIGPHAELNSSTLFSLIASRAKADHVSRHAYLARILKDAGFQDVPSKGNWVKWEQRKRIADVWFPTVLYAVLIAGEKLTFKDLLKVKEHQQ